MLWIKTRGWGAKSNLCSASSMLLLFFAVGVRVDPNLHFYLRPHTFQSFPPITSVINCHLSIVILRISEEKIGEKIWIALSFKVEKNFLLCLEMGETRRSRVSRWEDISPLVSNCVFCIWLCIFVYLYLCIRVFGEVGWAGEAYPPSSQGGNTTCATQGNTRQHKATQKASHALSQKQQHSAVAVLTFSQKGNVPAKAIPHLTEILLAIWGFHLDLIVIALGSFTGWSKLFK